jgi:hypothetical protein
MSLSPALLRHFANHYMDFIALVQAGVISREVAGQWCSEIWRFIYTTNYSLEAKAA